MKNIESLIADDSFQRWIANEASPEEKKHWQTWIHSDTRHKELYEEAVSLWHSIQFKAESLPDVEEELISLQKRLGLTKAKRASVRNIAFRKDDLNAKKIWWRYGAIAAIVMLFLLWQYSPLKHQFLQPDFEITSTIYGERKTIEISLETIVVLNANSRLKYSSNENVQQFDLQGEAYFQFTPNEKNTEFQFIVLTDDGKVKVRGTKFVVNTRKKETQVIVEKGQVEISVSNEIETDLPISILLNAGQLLNFKKNDTILRPQEVNALVYTSWHGDELIFDNTPFAEIAQRLEETHDIKIDVTNKALLEKVLSGSIENRDLQVIVEALSKALNTEVEQVGKTITFSAPIL